MKYCEGMPKPPRGFWIVEDRIELIPHGEEGFDPMAAAVDLVEYYAALADSQLRYAAAENPQGEIRAETNLASGNRHPG